MLKTADPDPVRSLDEHQRRVALALAEAILPSTARLRGGDERTVADTERVVGHISPWATKLWKGALALLDRSAVLSTGRRFSKLSGDEQQRLLEKWEKDPVMRGPLTAVAFAFKFTHFDSVDTYESMGGKLNVVQNIEEPRWLSQIVEASDWDDPDDLECDVVVVGTGAGGAIVGKELADRGLAVLFVEEGQHHRRDSFTGSSIKAHFDYYRGAITLGNAPMPIFIGKLVGGSTAVNTGSCFRTPPWVLDRWCETIGTDAFSSDAMRPYFERVERAIGVAPADAAAVGPIAALMARGCDAHGWEHRRMLRNAPGCEGEGFCDFGCRTDARKSTNLSYIPPALEKGAMVFTGLRATRVLTDGGRASGIEGVDSAGRTMRVRARTVVFSGGALPTPVFLLKQGICNSSGQVGRNLTLHPSTGLSALMDEDISGHRYIPQGYYVEEFVKEGILINAAQPDKNFTPILFPFTGHRLMKVLEESDRIASFGVLISDTGPGGAVYPGPEGMPLVRYNLTKGDVARMHRGLSLAGRMAWSAGAKTVYPVCVPMPVVERESDWKRFEDMDLKAADLQLTSYHPLGTCKMGHDPKTSVVDLDHQSHDLPGLFLVDGSTVPGPLGVNPQITIMAMATRAADRIAELIT